MDVSVIVVSDYQAGPERTWHDERECLDALARQDFEGLVEIILCLEESTRDLVPPDLGVHLPHFRLHFVPSTESYVQKNLAISLAKAPFVGMIDADCCPRPNWLRHSLETLRGNPKVAAVSGRTMYPRQEPNAHIYSLLGRAFLDPGHSGETRYISNNSSVYRTDAYARFPLPEGLGPFAARIQSEAMFRAGYIAWFDDRIFTEHHFEGWQQELDIRRNSGWGTVTTRLNDPELPYASLVRMGPVTLPLVWGGKLFDTFCDTLRCYRHDGLRAAEVPYAMAVAFRLSLAEIPGMLRAWRRQPLAETAYR